MNELKLDFFHNGATKKTRAFSLWVHTAFMPAEGHCEFEKAQLDKALKDKQVGGQPKVQDVDGADVGRSSARCQLKIKLWMGADVGRSSARCQPKIKI